MKIKMMNFPAILISLQLLSAGCNNQEASNQNNPGQNPKAASFELSDYLADDPLLKQKTDSVFDSWTPEQRLSRMIITSAGELGKPKSAVKRLAENDQIGGVLFLKGKSTDHQQFIDSLKKISTLPLFFSIDAEPSLIARRLPDVEQKFKSAAEISNRAEAQKAGTEIAKIISNLGFNWNYAPVVDLSTDNEAISTRSFGSDPEEVIQKASGFIRGMRSEGVIGCIKHFPGHGRVKGDTHKERVYIDGELTELPVYKPLIDSGALSIMVAHVAVQNNEHYQTGGAPATCSRNIVTDLLRKELGFKGLIITDAMNMEAAVKEGESAPLTAAKAGNDLILMPPDEAQLLQNMLQTYRSNPQYREQWDHSVKRIIRLMICSGIL